jgi:serine protease Do
MPSISTPVLAQRRDPPPLSRVFGWAVLPVDPSSTLRNLGKWGLLLFGLAFVQSAQACDAASQNACAPRFAQQDLADALLKRVRSSLVEIDTGLVRIHGQEGHASGFVTGQTHWVVTNLHAIDNSLNEPDDIRVTVRGSQDQRLSARVIALDARHDLALLETGLPLKGQPLTLAPEVPSAGEYVVAIGSPTTQGFIAKGGRLQGATAGDALELRATLEPGMSGGPVLNTRGQVVGVNRAVFNHGSRNSDIVALEPLRRLLERARQAPYADDAALRQDIHLQHRALGTEMAKAWVNRATTRDRLGPFRVSAPLNDCEGSRFKRPEDHFDVYRIRCDGAWDDEPKQRLPMPGHRMTHYWIHNPAFHALQAARAGDYMMDYLRDDTFTKAHRQRSDWECRYTRLTNAHGLTLDLHACRRQHLNWRGFADHRLRALALVPGPDVLVSVLDLDAFDADSARRMTSTWLDGLQHRPDARVTRSAP